ncbi:MAG: hypothetical protein KBS64_03180 [Treponema sp.]|nr:hypothetical protein [Candidatus Treponema equi]
MEELRSTDVLDREIRADSEKKAQKLLEKAKDNAKSLLDEVDNRIEKAREDAMTASKARLDFFEKNEKSSVPLEKQRYLVSYIDDSVMKAVSDYFENLSSEKKELAIENLVKKAKAVIGDRNVTATATGALDAKKAEGILSRVLGSACKKVEQGAGNDDDILSYGMIVVTEDKKVTCRLTLREKVDELLAMNRQQLALSLFNGRLPE